MRTTPIETRSVTRAKKVQAALTKPLKVRVVLWPPTTPAATRTPVPDAPHKPARPRIHMTPARPLVLAPHEEYGRLLGICLARAATAFRNAFHK